MTCMPAAKTPPRAPRLVGRDEACRALDAALLRAVRFGAPQVVTVLGPLGIGKSRLLREWSAAARDGVRLVAAMAPAAAGKPSQESFSLVAALLRARFGVDERLDPAAALAAFGTELQRVFGDRRVAEVTALLGRFLGIDLPPSPLGQALAARPDQAAEVARAVLCRFLEEDAADRPLVVVIDDLHLADDASLDLLAHLGGELGDAAIAIVVAARPDLLLRRPGWGGSGGSQSRVELAGLSPLEMDVFIRAALGAETLAPGLADRAAVESGGNPFLLEQLLRVYLDHGILAADTGTAFRFDAAAADSTALDLGPEAAAAARLAELSPAERDLLARAAVFGTAFWTGGIIALGRLGIEPSDPRTVFAPDPTIEEVRRTLTSLAEREICALAASSAIPGETEWAFAVEAERALLVAGVDPETTRRRKRFAAHWLEARAPATGDRCALIGALFEEGGDERRAAHAFIAAADEARGQRRHERARGFYARGLGLLAADDPLVKLDVLHKLGDAAARLGRSREALEHFGAMLKVAWHMDLPAKGGAAHVRIGRLHRALGDYRRAIEHLDLGRLLFDLADDRPGVAAALDDIGRVHFLTGAAERAMRCHRDALALREAQGDHRGQALTLSFMGTVEAQAGRLAAAERCFARSLRICRETRDTHGVVFALIDLAVVAREAGKPARALPLLEEARRLARQMGQPLTECHVTVQIGQSRLAAGDVVSAEAELRAARDTARKFGARRLEAEATCGIAEARQQAGDHLAARDHAHAAATLAEKIGATPLAGAALRVLATAVTRGAPGDPDRGGAREIFDRAVELLGGAGAELELGRTLAAYAELEARTGRAAVARKLRAQAQTIRQRARATLDADGRAAVAPAP